MKKLRDRIEKQQARICIVGLGYVGLPLAIAFARKGFKVIGYEKSTKKVAQLMNQESYLSHIKVNEFDALVKAKTLCPTYDFSDCVRCDVFIVCVPTPLTKNRTPDLQHVTETACLLAKTEIKNKLFILESTTYPGTTREVFGPTINSDEKLKVGRDFFVASSPERQDPGNTRYQTHNIPKVVGGVTRNCLSLAACLYRQVIEQVVEVANADTAEMVKIYENVYRAVNIALVNEMKMLCHGLGIDIWDVVVAASTKPFGFQAFKPGPGLGGHCIPIDPFYLTWRAREVDMATKFIELAGEVNTSMPYYVVKRIGEALNTAEKSTNGAKILIMGVAYKADVNDLRESPALKIMKILLHSGADLSYHDPYIGEIEVDGVRFESASLEPTSLKEADLVVIVTNHKKIDWPLVARYSNMVVDCRNVEMVKNAIGFPRYVSA